MCFEHGLGMEEALAFKGGLSCSSSKYLEKGVFFFSTERHQIPKFPSRYQNFPGLSFQNSHYVCTCISTRGQNKLEVHVWVIRLQIGQNSLLSPIKWSIWGTRGDFLGNFLISGNYGNSALHKRIGKYRKFTKSHVWGRYLHLRGFYTPNVKLACFVLYFKIINTSLKNSMHVKANCPRKSKIVGLLNFKF